MIRIIAGQWRGRKLRTPDWTGLRPTSDRLRETLFNILAAEIPGCDLLQFRHRVHGRDVVGATHGVRGIAAELAKIPG